jgi:hypothetical protein
VKSLNRVSYVKRIRRLLVKIVRLIGLAVGAYCLEYVLTAIRISTWVMWDFWWIGRFIVNVAVGLVGIWLALELVIEGKAGARQVVLGGCVLVFFGLEMFWRSPLGFILYGELPAFEPPLLAVAMLTARYLVVGAAIFLGINMLRTKRFPPLSTGLFLLIFSSYMILYNGYLFVTQPGYIVGHFVGLRGRLDLLLRARLTYRLLSGLICWGLMTVFGFCGVFIGARLTKVREMRELVSREAQPKYKDPWVWIIIALTAYGLAESSTGFILFILEITSSSRWLWNLGDLRELLLGIILLFIGRKISRAYKLKIGKSLKKSVSKLISKISQFQERVRDNSLYRWLFSD